jgi:hypothetical protein
MCLTAGTIMQASKLPLTVWDPSAVFQISSAGAWASLALETTRRIRNTGIGKKLNGFF